jgi:chemotaxis family two-component system response regulator Rcp1
MPIQNASRPIEILLVEDNPGDIRLTQEVLRTTRTPNHVRVAVDGVEAMEILERQGRHANAPLPDLILLDLNLPRKDGRQVLADVKVDPALKRIPIIILTTSAADQEVARAYDLHANCYIIKPVDYQQFLSVARAIESFWLTIVSLPAVG